MSRHYKEVKNGRGTTLTIGPDAYLSVGYSGEDVMIRGDGKVVAFDSWKDFVNAIDSEKSTYHKCDYPNYGKVGNCLVNQDGEILELERGWCRQGMVFKDSYAFDKGGNAPCYVPETSDTVYTKADFLKIALGQEEIARMIFDAVDWQHPETYLDELYVNGELDICESCGKIFESYGAEKCPHCGTLYEEEQWDD